MSKAISPLAAEPKVATVNETCDLLRVSRGTIHKLGTHINVAAGR